MSLDQTAKLAVLREAVERADTLASTQSKLIANQEQLIATLRSRIKFLESLLSENAKLFLHD
jgi:hypothetical protein